MLKLSIFSLLIIVANNKNGALADANDDFLARYGQEKIYQLDPPIDCDLVFKPRAGGQTETISTTPDGEILNMDETKVLLIQKIITNIKKIKRNKFNLK